MQCVRGKIEASLDHVRSGVRIISEAQNNNRQNALSKNNLAFSKKPLVPLELLTVQFVRLDTQLNQVCPSRFDPLSLLEPVDEEVPGFGPILPTVFSSLEEARNSLDYLANEAIHFDRQFQSLEDEVDRQALHARFAQWKSAYFAFMRLNESSLDAENMASAHCLRINQIITSLLLHNATVQENESVWTTFPDETCEIVERATAISKLTGTNDGARSKRSGTALGKVPDDRAQHFASFILYTAIIAALIEVAWEHHDSSVRSAAVGLLQTQHRTDEVWDETVIAAIEETIKRVDEDGSRGIDRLEDLCEWRRLHDCQTNMYGHPRDRRVM